MKECTNCGKEKELTEFYKQGKYLRAICKDCSKLFAREWYSTENGIATQRNSRLKQVASGYKKANSSAYRKRKVNECSARQAVSNAIRDKRLFKKPCEICGEIKVEAHHTDYSKHLEVTWLCKKHHTLLHRDLRKSNKVIVQF